MKRIVVWAERHLWSTSAMVALCFIAAVALAVFWLHGVNRDRQQARETARLAHQLDLQQAQLLGLVFRIDEISTETHEALCTLKQDLRRRLNTTEAFIRRHPDGIPGISRADLDRSLAGQQATLASLVSLTCD